MRRSSRPAPPAHNPPARPGPPAGPQSAILVGSKEGPQWQGKIESFLAEYGIKIRAVWRNPGDPDSTYKADLVVVTSDCCSHSLYDAAKIVAARTGTRLIVINHRRSSAVTALERAGFRRMAAAKEPEPEPEPPGTEPEPEPEPDPEAEMIETDDTDTDTDTDAEMNDTDTDTDICFVYLHSTNPKFRPQAEALAADVHTRLRGMHSYQSLQIRSEAGIRVLSPGPKGQQAVVDEAMYLKFCRDLGVTPGPYTVLPEYRGNTCPCGRLAGGVSGYCNVHYRRPLSPSPRTQAPSPRTQAPSPRAEAPSPRAEAFTKEDGDLREILIMLKAEMATRGIKKIEIQNTEGGYQVQFNRTVNVRMTL